MTIKTTNFIITYHSITTLYIAATLSSNCSDTINILTIICRLVETT